MKCLRLKDKMKNKLLPLLLTCCIGIGTHGDEDRVRYVDAEKQKAFASNSATFPLPGRERRAGKSGEADKSAPPEPNEDQTSHVENNVPALPGIAELEYDIRALKTKLKESEENLDLAAQLVEDISKENSQNKKRISELESSPGTPFNGWVWGQELGWVYSSHLIAPYYYSQDQGWFFYELGSTPRIIYKFKTKKWTTLNEK
jgi:hypothetical protein